MQEQKFEMFDFIVVGAGSSGSAVAYKLSEGGQYSVLVLDQGPGKRDWMLTMPKGFGHVLRRGKHVSTHPLSRPAGEPQNDSWIRGRTLGGSSAVNGMIWIRCQRADFDDIAAAGNSGWSWHDMAPYFNALDGGDAGNDGLIKTTMPPPTAVGEAFLGSGEAMGLTRQLNFNGPEQEGVAYLARNIDRRGRRFDARAAFLNPARQRKNLRLEVETQIDRLLMEGRKVVGVEGRQRGAAVRFGARREVILCAGTPVSPLILQRSGIGPADLLRRHGIAPVVDNPRVGSGLSEHFLLNVQYQLRDWRYSENREYDGWRLIRHVLQYMLNGKGLMSQSAYQAAAFARSSRELNRPDMQLMFAPFSRSPGGVTKFESYPGISIFGYLLRPESRGTIQITSADPDAAPEIVPNYLSAPSDREASVRMIRAIRDLASHGPLAAVIERELAPTAGANTDAEILQTYLNYGRAGMHACGACAMGPAERGVVNARLRVHGVEGLRVGDISVFPDMLSGNTNAPAMALGLKAGDLILNDQR